jgi:signal peptidase I
MEFMDLNDDVQEEAKTGTEEKKEPDNKKEKEEFSWGRELLSWILTFAIAIGVTILFKNYVVISANIPSGSMENTIMTGDDLLGFRLAYVFSQPERGDIIIFKYPDDESQKFIKRVIGLPGERVVIKDAKIYINNSETPLDETYLKEEWTYGTGVYTFDIPRDSYLVLGDNRNDSNDARFWDNTYVTKSEIIGKAEFIYYPFDHIKSLRQ